MINKADKLNNNVNKLNNNLLMLLTEYDLYSQLKNISLDDNEDSIIWRWSVREVFITHSCYTWLEFGGINNSQFSLTWSAYIPLKIKIFLWLVQKNKILTKDNLRKKG
jgi:zinc-binding in reverse transcriptase